MSLAAQAVTNPTASHTSYWSVPEQNKFPELLAYYGRDFAAIAEFMKTKSQTMIKNYYLRQVNDGKTEFEKLGQLGDQARMEDRTLPRPPSPIALQKRRYEPTPTVPSIARHPIQAEQGLVESESMIKPGLIEEFPRNTVERTATGEIVSKPRLDARGALREGPLPGSNAAKIEELSRLADERAPLYGQKPLHGPRTGIFQEEHLGFQASRQNVRLPLDERSPQLHPQRPLSEVPRSEINHPTSVPSLAQTILTQRERDSMAH
ncbi:hypothetical protein LTR40_012530, partial [Exophiala xenobiotica]